MVSSKSSINASKSGLPNMASGTAGATRSKRGSPIRKISRTAIGFFAQPELRP